MSSEAALRWNRRRIIARFDWYEDPDASLSEWPEFERECLVDDPEDPTEVTILGNYDDADLTTTWLTADLDTAISMEEGWR